MPLVPYQRPRTGLQAAFWLVPFAVLGGSRPDGPLTWALGLALGVAWQLVYRRDLVDRLTTASVFYAAGVGLALVVYLLGGGDSLSASDGAGALACVAGLVLTEQALRARDLRAHRRAQARRATSPAEAVPARP